MENKFDFKNLFVLDLANNHQGDLEHGLKIIREAGKVVRKHKIRAAIKFQFRQLETFIHPEYKNDKKLQHINRFVSTKLSLDQYEKLFHAAKNEGFYCMCTPFDETSVDIIETMNFDIIKAASCSAKDWPLLEKISTTNLPIIFSTGGLNLREIDNLVSFFEHRYCDFAIMHCVSIYPTPDKEFNLNQIDVLINRYPNNLIGWSTHEDPNDLLPITIAISKGAKIFEKHIGISNEKYSLNSYSANPDQLDKWLTAGNKTLSICGTHNKDINDLEIDSINSLKRGVYINKKIKKDSILKKEDIFFAMPLQEGQLESGKWGKNLRILENLKPNQPINLSAIKFPLKPKNLILKTAIHEVKAMLSEAKIYLNSEFEVEYSHHYGLEKFQKYGAVIVNVINREYCKKIIIQLPYQKHPAHHHKLKEETFHLLHGTLDIWIDGKKKRLNPGDTCLVLPGVWHSFTTETGCIFEEISTTHYNNDSVYKDIKINKMDRSKRKTKVNHWGRYEIPNLQNEL